MLSAAELSAAGCDSRESPMKKHLSTILLVLVFIVGLAVLLYPSVSDLYNSSLHSAAINDYDAVLNTLTEQDYSQYWSAVDAYNEKIRGRGTVMGLVNGEPQDQEYMDTLNVPGTGMMGYIEIPSIDVRLPIYPGTSDAVLSAGVGHIEGSSLPGGGKGTHAILSGHRGLPSATLFTDLDELVEGDVFYLHILDRTLAYQVDQISTVLPTEVGNLTLDPEKDYVTLITCTPYGVNSHRLLVRGVRIAHDEEREETPQYTFRVHRDVEIYGVSIIAPIAMVPLLILVLIYVLVRYRNRKSS